MSFVHLHAHTDYSLLDGMGKVSDYVKKVKEAGMSAAAITDHGTMAGCVEFFDACKKNGIKPIIGSEFYEAPNSRFEKDNANRYYHLILLAKNEEGYKNLCYLTTRANSEGFYYNPRIDFELLKEHHEGLVCLSACLAGRIPQAILHGRYEEAEAAVKKYKDLFGDDFYLEIQNHGIRDEMTVATYIPKLAEKYGVKIVCTNDCHYVNSEDREAHEWLLCMQTGKTLDEPHLVYEGDYSVKSEKDMRALFPSLPEAFDNTNEIADKCNFEFEYGKYRMPKVIIPQEWGTDYYGYMESEAWKGFENRYPKGHARRDEATERLNYELGIIKQMGFAEYFLDTRKTILWAREHGIIVGPGRGSGVGSVMNYCLGITDIEPLQHQLLFERFLNPERVSMPDIDVDYEMLYKDDVIRSEAESNGYDKFAKIRTYMTMAAKGVLKDCVRTYGLPVEVGVKMAKFIPNEVGMTLQKAYELNPDIKKFLDTDPDYQKVWNIALKLEGTKKSASTHACGHIPTPVPCEELFPCAVDNETGYLICEYNMAEAEHLGNLKKDLLMLRNLAIIDIAHNAVKEETGEILPLWNDTVLNDKETLKMIANGDTGGVFQLESAGMKGFMKQLKPTCFEDIVAGVALYRPGPMDYIPKYVEGKHHPETVTYATPALEPILKNTYGVIVYQEQVMQITQALAGFSMGEADVVRKGMAKKKEEILAEEKGKFIYGTEKFVGCVHNGVSEDIAKPLWADMEQFGKYAFNKSHAVAYAAIAMQTAYLKCHHPKEFYAGLLTSVMDKTSSLAVYIRESKERGVVIDPPNINTSDVNFSVGPNGHLRYGLASIKGLGKDAIEDALKEREMGAYTSLYDFMDRNRGLNSAAITNLINAGAFDFTGYNRASLAASVKPFQTEIKNKTKKIIKGQLSLFDMGDMGISGSGDPDIIEKPDLPRITKLMNEKEATGLFITEHPLENSRYKDIPYTPLIEITGTEEEPSHFKKWDNVTVHGIITELKTRYDKNGNKMCFLEIEDDCATVSVAVFNNTYSKYYDFEEKDIVTVTGKISDRNETLSVNADQIFKEDALDRAIYVKLEDGKRPEDFKTSVQSIMRKAYDRSSNKQVLFPVWINATREQKQALGLNTRQFLAGYTNSFPETIGVLEEYLGEENVKVGIRGCENDKAEKKKQQTIER